MNFGSLFLVLLSLFSYVAGQLFVKKAMESTHVGGMASRQFAILLAAGIGAMTISFFLTLGLLQRFDLSYLYPFQGLSVIIITLLAAAFLKEKLTFRLTAGAGVITAGVILVSLS